MITITTKYYIEDISELIWMNKFSIFKDDWFLFDNKTNTFRLFKGRKPVKIALKEISKEELDQTIFLSKI